MLTSRTRNGFGDGGIGWSTVLVSRAINPSGV